MRIQVNKDLRERVMLGAISFELRDGKHCQKFSERASIPMDTLPENTKMDVLKLKMIEDLITKRLPYLLKMLQKQVEDKTLSEPQKELVPLSDSWWIE